MSPDDPSSTDEPTFAEQFDVEDQRQLVDSVSIIQAEMGDDESLLWAGRPRQGFVLRSSDITTVPFSLAWTGFAMVWEFQAISRYVSSADTVSLTFSLFGLPFVLIGLYLTFGRFVFDARCRAKTHYGLTDQRIIIVYESWRRKVKSMSLRGLTDVALHQKRHGFGTITFGPTEFRARGSRPITPDPTRAFELIPDAKSVYDLMEEARSSAA